MGCWHHELWSSIQKCLIVTSSRFENSATNSVGFQNMCSCWQNNPEKIHLQKEYPLTSHSLLDSRTSRNTPGERIKNSTWTAGAAVIGGERCLSVIHIGGGHTCRAHRSKRRHQVSMQIYRQHRAAPDLYFASEWTATLRRISDG